MAAVLFGLGACARTTSDAGPVGGVALPSVPGVFQLLGSLGGDPTGRPDTVEVLGDGRILLDGVSVPFEENGDGSTTMVAGTAVVDASPVSLEGRFQLTVTEFPRVGPPQIGLWAYGPMQ